MTHGCHIGMLSSRHTLLTDARMSLRHSEDESWRSEKVGLATPFEVVRVRILAIGSGRIQTRLSVRSQLAQGSYRDQIFGCVSQ